MNILITGAQGFIAKNLIEELRNRNQVNIMEYSRETDFTVLKEYCKKADFVFHLAGINRPKENSEYLTGNVGFTRQLIKMLKMEKNNCPIMVSSSIQADLKNPYGESKKEAEQLVIAHGKETGARVLIYRFPNVFGKWARPNYNSAISTFCYNISRNQAIQINDYKAEMNLVYIDDVVNELINSLTGKENRINEYCKVSPVYRITLGEIVELIQSFKESRNNKSIPNMGDSFTKKLYSTYLSYIPETEFGYKLKMNKDERGSFTEFIKSPDRGQVSVNISKPGIVKGNHWHHTKNEKFLVVSGDGVIRFRRIGSFSNEIIEYFVSGESLEVIDIPVGYTHNIENVGKVDLVTIMWANEEFNPNQPDTYFVEV